MRMAGLCQFYWVLTHLLYYYYIILYYYYITTLYLLLANKISDLIWVTLCKVNSLHVCLFVSANIRRTSSMKRLHCVAGSSCRHDGLNMFETLNRLNESAPYCKHHLRGFHSHGMWLAYYAPPLLPDPPSSNPSYSAIDAYPAPSRSAMPFDRRHHSYIGP